LLGDDSVKKANELAKGGIFTALSLLCVYLSTIIPISKIYILAFGTCIIVLSVLTTGIKNSVIVYASTSLLSFIMLGLKWNVFAYVILFGSYGFIKYYIEKMHNIILETIIKLVFFNLCVVIINYLFIILLGTNPNIRIPIAFALIMLQPIFLICDYAITLFIAYVNKHYLKYIK
jgi:hypothetical protein